MATPPGGLLPALLVLALGSVAGVCHASAFLDMHSARASAWVSHGGSILNQRWARREWQLSPSTAPSLALRWEFGTAGDVSATPALYRGALYAPDWAGFLYKVNQTTGALLWARNMTSYGFPEGTISRTTPAVAEAADVLVFGTMEPAYAVAVKRSSGALLWRTLLDPNPFSLVTGGGTVYKGAFFVGVSSSEEIQSLNTSYKCCSFIGSVVKLDLRTGQILWQTYTLPRREVDPYSGGGVWAASPPIDTKLGVLYAGVGNMYTVPESVQRCRDAQGNETKFPDPCVEPGNHFDSVVALDVETGDYVWARTFNPIDAYTIACTVFGPGSPNCPPGPGPDADFGMNPLLLRIRRPTSAGPPAFLDVVIIGQKSGAVYALERASERLVWVTQAGPGGKLGGAAWGLSTDGERIFVGIENSDRLPFVLVPSNTTIDYGGWVALNASTGEVLWSVANRSPLPALAMLPSQANGVVLVASADPEGHVHALDAAGGRTLWQFSPGVSVYGGVSVANGCIFFGVGYGTNPLGPIYNLTGGGPQSIYSFCIQAPALP